MEGTGNKQEITKVLNVTTKEGRIPGVPDLQYKSGKAAWRKRLLKRDEISW